MTYTHLPRLRSSARAQTLDVFLRDGFEVVVVKSQDALSARGQSAQPRRSARQTRSRLGNSALWLLTYTAPRLGDPDYVIDTITVILTEQGQQYREAREVKWFR